MGTSRPRWSFRIGAALLVGAGLLAACSGSGSDGGDGARSGEPTDDGASGQFSVLSYNVAGLPVEVSSESPDVNMPLISPKLEDYDVVLTQEDFDWWNTEGAVSGLDFVNYHDRLRADTTHEYATEAHPGPEAVALDTENRPAPEVGDGLGVLSRFPITEADRVPWVGCANEGAADCLSMKGFLFTRMTLADGVEVDVYNLHGEAGGSDADQQLQADGYAQLGAYIVANSEGRAIVLAGDTNLHTDEPPEDPQDAQDVEIWAQFLETTGLTDACDPTDCATPGDIDKAAFRSGGGVEIAAVTHQYENEVFVDDAGEDLSDHPALEVVFSWGEQ